MLRDASGTEVGRSTFQMDTFFARTDALVSVSLATLLPPGYYTIDLTLTDAMQSAAITGLIPLIVGAPAPSAAPGSGPAGPGGAPGSLELLIAAVLIALAVLGLGAIRTVRKHRRLRPATT